VNRQRTTSINKDLLKSLVVIDRLEIGSARLEPRRLKATYKVIQGRKPDSFDLIYKFEEDVFSPGEQSDQNLGDMIAAQIALNYGLFAKEIRFKGSFDSRDQKFLRAMAENTACEIYVKKFLEHNPFLIGAAAKVPVVRRQSYLRSNLIFEGDPPSKKDLWKSDETKYAVLSSGGKDSLLSFGLVDELGFEAHPIFINESGRHWHTALNSYRYFKAKVQETSRVWTNSDRLFNWMLRHLPFIRRDFASIGSDEYPVRLWTLAVFIFGALPILRKRGLGRLIIGNEYDTTRRWRHNGIPHFDGLFDQSRQCDNAMSRYYRRKGWGIEQLSILRPLSELMIEKILLKRYPHLQRNQVSCHATHIRDGRVFPCGKCEKCRRIVGMLVALEANPGRCGYTRAHIKSVLNQLSHTRLRQDAVSAEHLLYLLSKREMLAMDRPGTHRQRPHREIEKLMFDEKRSLISEIPGDIRVKLIRLYLEHAKGIVRRQDGSWVEIDPKSISRA
jgi:hypothetical protein